MNYAKNNRDNREITVEKVYVTWNDVEEFINHLATITNNFKNYTGIYGPARGGVIFAAIISNRYGLPYLGAPQVGSLVIDDIVDSGDTAKTWRDKGYKIASMYYNKKSTIEPDYWWKEKNDKWIVFPIERNNEGSD